MPPVRLRLVLLFAIATAGCGGEEPAGSVSGSVHYRDRPVAEGRIEFVPDGPGKSVAGEVASGKYALPRIAPGKYRVVVRGWREGHDYIRPEAEGNDAPVEIRLGAQTHDASVH